MIPYSLYPQKCRIDVEKFSEELIRVISKCGLEIDFAPFIDKLKEKGNDDVFQSHGDEDFKLVDNLESLFFKILLGEVKSNSILAKYTNLDCLMRICKDDEIGMVSLAGMNDSTECNYAESYLKRHGYKPNLSDEDNIYLGLHLFITSFTDLDDDLTMWRLYGNDASGICLQFKLETDLPDDFLLSPVSYADESGNHPELDLIVEMLSISIAGRKFEFGNFYTWRHFFKPYEYSVENEIRLLCKKNKSDVSLAWITTGEGIVASLAKFAIEDKSSHFKANRHPLYPLTLRGIKLGPQFVESQLNIETIKIMLCEKFGWIDKNVKIESSHIVNYRNSKK